MIMTLLSPGAFHSYEYFKLNFIPDGQAILVHKRDLGF